MGSGCSMWGRGTSPAWRATWCRWTAPGWNCQLPRTAESSPSTGLTACKDTAASKWSHDRIAMSHFLSHTNDKSCLLQFTARSVHLKVDADSLFFFLSHYRTEDKCLQGVANATMSGMTSHATCMYLQIFTAFFCLHPDSPSLSLCCVMICGRCMQPKHITAPRCRWIS